VPGLRESDSPLDREKVLALDIDGVILRTTDESDSWRSVFSETFDVDSSLLQGSFFRPPWPEVVRGLLPIESALGEAISTLGWVMSVEEALQVWFEADFYPDLDVIRAANEWASDGVRVVLVSNQEHRRADYLRERLGSLLSAEIICSADVGYIKSERLFYDSAERRLAFSDGYQEVVFVDDTLENVEVATAHGWSGLHFVETDSWRSLIGESLGSRLPEI
jgi:putative hydrolase of the HAD superfamily